MSTKPYTSFSKVSHIGDSLFTSELESNLKWYMDWAMLGIGGWSDIAIPTSGAFGGDFSDLRAVQDPSYTNGEVWESARKDWVWETGDLYSDGGSDYSATQISGVHVNGALYGTGDATYGHHYDYPNGRVVFDSAIPTSSTVELDYSYRNVQVYIADQAEWWDELQFDSLRVDDPSYSAAGSGGWGILANHRVQMPAIVIEAVPRRTFKPYQMGDTSQFVKQDVLFHIVAESRWWRNQLVDVISLQKDDQIWLYNSNTVASSGDYPLDYRGMRVTSPKNYNDIVENTGYRYKSARITEMSIGEMQSYNSRLHEGTVRATFEVVLS
jgi:hypothetical protein